MKERKQGWIEQPRKSKTRTADKVIRYVSYLKLLSFITEYMVFTKLLIKLKCY